MTWFAFRVPSQREFTAQDFLVSKRGFEAASIFVCHECRLLKRRSRKDPERWSNRSIIPGYIFIQTDDPFEIVRRFGIIQSVLQSDGIARPIRDADMESLQSISGQIARSKSAPNIRIWVEGDYVRISDGPLKGLKGRVAKNGSVKLDLPLLGSDVVKVKQEVLEAA